jgi:hypothetical protein
MPSESGPVEARRIDLAQNPSGAADPKKQVG